MEGSENKNRIEAFGEKDNFSYGADSDIFILKTEKGDMIAKEYYGLRKNFKPEEVKFILENYYADTESAQQLLEQNPNPLNQSLELDNKSILKLDTQSIPIEYRVVPQGGMYLEDNEKHHQYVVSQKKVDGINLEKLLYYKKHELDDQGVFTDSGVRQQLTDYSRKMFGYINKSLDVHFIYDSSNIIPHFEDNKAVIYITDLAGRIGDYYQLSPRIKKYRAEHNLHHL